MVLLHTFSFSFSVTPVAAVRVLLTLSFLLLMVGNSIAKSIDYAVPEEIVRPGSKAEVFYARRLSPPLAFSDAPAKFEDIPNVEGNMRMLLATIGTPSKYRASPQSKYPPPKAPPGRR